MMTKPTAIWFGLVTEDGDSSRAEAWAWSILSEPKSTKADLIAVVKMCGAAEAQGLSDAKLKRTRKNDLRALGYARLSNEALDFPEVTDPSLRARAGLDD